MDNSAFKKILDRARSDQAYAQALLFDPKRALREAGLPQEVIDGIVVIDPEYTIRTIISGRGQADCGVTVSCGETCTYTSSLALEGGEGRPGASVADCGVTVNCTSTCTHTSSRELGDLVSNPASGLGGVIRGKLSTR
jgi:hypothetical protein